MKIDEYLGFSLREMAGIWKILSEEECEIWRGYAFKDQPRLNYEELIELTELLEKTITRFARPKKEGELFLNIIDEILKTTIKD